MIRIDIYFPPSSSLSSSLSHPIDCTLTSVNVDVVGLDDLADEVSAYLRDGCCLVTAQILRNFSLFSDNSVKSCCFVIAAKDTFWSSAGPTVRTPNGMKQSSRRLPNTAQITSRETDTSLLRLSDPAHTSTGQLTCPLLHRLSRDVPC